MKQKATVLICFLLITAFLAGCTGGEVSAETGTKVPEMIIPSQNDTGGVQEVSEAAMDNNERTPLQEVTYLWEEGNMPFTTVYADNNSNYSDPPGFRPNMVYYPAKEGVEVKGAVMICAGGAFQVRAGSDEAPVAAGLNALGYHCFVVEYRLRPYTQEEAALDLARAVRYVRSYAEELGMNENAIATIGFSAGGILCGEQALNFTGLVNGTVLDTAYTPDELDKVSADVGAVSMVYSFYGRLSVASTDVEKFSKSDLPPTYFLYGSEEVFRNQIEACAAAVSQAGVSVESRMLDGWQHGFGGRGDWFEGFDTWLTPIFQSFDNENSISGLAKTSGDLSFPLGNAINAPSFTGTAYLSPMIANEEVFSFPQTNNIIFEPGARSIWHTHGGMIILVTGGVGYYQEEGQPVQIIRKGDVIECAPGVKHWHGAMPDSWFSQMVIYDSHYVGGESESPAVEPVTDEYYAALKADEYAGRIIAADSEFMFPRAEQPAMLETFSGPIYLSSIIAGENVADAPELHYVVFEPGVINNWHTHAGGQIMIATDGIGYHQMEGGAVEVLYPGDVALCPPGVKYWHGGSADTRFAHIAINTNPKLGGVEWFDRISEETYSLLPTEKAGA